MGKIKIRIVAIMLIVCILSGCGKKVGEAEISKGNGTYFMFNNILHYYDADSKKAVPLCFDATCNHTSERWNSCGAFRKTEHYEQPEVGEYLDCSDGRIWHIGEYLYMIESKTTGEWTSADTLVRYDKFGNNKETIVQLNEMYEYTGLYSDVRIGLKIIDNYLYYVKTVRAGNVNNNLNKEVIYPENEGWKEDFESEELYKQHFAEKEAYLTFYRVPIDGSKKPEKISDEILFYGWYSDYMDYISKAVMIGGNHQDGITLVVSDMGNSPNIYGDHYFEPKCKVYTYKPGDAVAKKNAEFTFEDDRFEGTVQWKRSTPYVDNRGRVLFATTEELDDNQERFRMYAYTPYAGTYTAFYEKEGIRSYEKDGYENCARVTSMDDEYIYLFESTVDYYHINVFDNDLKAVDVLNVDCTGSWGGPMARHLGIMATTDDSIIMGTSVGKLKINTDSGVIGLSEEAIRFHDNSDNVEDNEYAQHGIIGVAYACVIDKSCIGTGKLKISKLMEYPYAGYKY